MSYKSITEALNQQLFDAALGYPIARENKSLDSENVDLYLDTYLLPADTESLGKASTDSREEIGIFQISIRMKTEIGSGKAWDALDLIKDAFPYAAEYTKDGVTVKLGETTSSNGRNINGRFVLDASINWTSYIQR